MAAIPFYLSMLEYWNVPISAVNTLAGYLTDEDNGRCLNGVTLTLSDGRTYVTDTYNSLFHLYSTRKDSIANGFYYFENIPAGIIELAVSAEGYYDTTLSVTTIDTFITFQAIQLVSAIPPFVKYSLPVDGDTATSVMEPVRLSFSRAMDAPSVEAAITIDPAIAGQISWHNDNHNLIFTPDKPFLMNTAYTFSIGNQAKDKHGHPIDGNQDGIGGDEFVLTFKTSAVDVFSPYVTGGFPPDDASNVETDAILTIVFNEALDPGSVTPSNVYVIDDFQDEVSGSIRYYTINQKGVICFYPDQPFYANSGYQFFLERGIKDLLGNPLSELLTLNFSTGESIASSGWIDNFDNGLSHWLFGDSTRGIFPDSTLLLSDSLIINLSSQSTHSMALSYQWDSLATGGLIQLSLDPTVSQKAVFDTSAILQARLFGDGSNNRFRFHVNEANDPGEVSSWINIDWLGWRSVSWELGSQAPAEWLKDSDGQLTGSLTLNSLHFGRTVNATRCGKIYLDDLRVLGIETKVVTDRTNLPAPDYELLPNFPNPFNPTTSIVFRLSESAYIRISIYNLRGQLVKTLVAKNMTAAGTHNIEWDGTAFHGDEVGSGVYLIKMQANNFQKTRKIILIR